MSEVLIIYYYINISKGWFKMQTKMIPFAYEDNYPDKKGECIKHKYLIKSILTLVLEAKQYKSQNIIDYEKTKNKELRELLSSLDNVLSSNVDLKIRNDSHYQNILYTILFKYQEIFYMNFFENTIIEDFFTKDDVDALVYLCSNTDIINLILRYLNTKEENRYNMIDDFIDHFDMISGKYIKNNNIKGMGTMKTKMFPYAYKDISNKLRSRVIHTMLDLAFRAKKYGSQSLIDYDSIRTKSCQEFFNIICDMLKNTKIAEKYYKDTYLGRSNRIEELCFEICNKILVQYRFDEKVEDYLTKDDFDVITYLFNNEDMVHFIIHVWYSDSHISDTDEQRHELISDFVRYFNLEKGEYIKNNENQNVLILPEIEQSTVNQIPAHQPTKEAITVQPQDTVHPTIQPIIPAEPTQPVQQPIQETVAFIDQQFNPFNRIEQEISQINCDQVPSYYQLDTTMISYLDITPDKKCMMIDRINKALYSQPIKLEMMNYNISNIIFTLDMNSFVNEYQFLIYGVCGKHIVKLNFYYKMDGNSIIPLTKLTNINILKKRRMIIKNDFDYWLNKKFLRKEKVVTLKYNPFNFLFDKYKNENVKNMLNYIKDKVKAQEIDYSLMTEFFEKYKYTQEKFLYVYLVLLIAFCDEEINAEILSIVSDFAALLKLTELDMEDMFMVFQILSKQLESQEDVSYFKGIHNTSILNLFFDVA